MEEWRNGGMEEWRDGGMEGRSNGGQRCCQHRPKACFIPAQGNALGSSPHFDLQAEGLPHMVFCRARSNWRIASPRYETRFQRFNLYLMPMNPGRCPGVALGWYERRLWRRHKPFAC